MTNLDPEICIRIKEARRSAKLSQVVVAAEVGCKQSALSAFEQGDGTKLNDDTIEKLAKKFDIDISNRQKGGQPVGAANAPAAFVVSEREAGFCPNPRCPTNRAYEVEGRVFRMPDLAAADPVGGKFCAMCGEVLVKKCPNCGSRIHRGGFCSVCGDPYVVGGGLEA